MVSESYPNNMSADYGYNALGEATHLEYVKTAGCGKASCPAVWYEDTLAPSIHGETLSDASTLASTSYVYDPAGRLTAAKETPAGKGCLTRLYGYDTEGNRKTVKESGPNAKNECSGENKKTRNTATTKQTGSKTLA